VSRIWSPLEAELADRSSSYEDYAKRSKARGFEPRSPGAYHSRRQRSGITRDLTNELELPDLDDYEGDLAAYYAAVKEVTAAKIKLAEAPMVVEWEAPVQGWIGLVFFGDLHIGGMVDYDQLERDLDLVERTEGLFCVGMGDYSERFEGAGKLQHAMAVDPVPGSDDQELLVRYVLGGCRKWICVLAGNHDDFGGGEGVRRLAKLLGAPYVSQAGASLKLRVGHERYVMYLKHQYSGASRLSSSNEGRRLWTEWPDFENADVTQLAHLHQPDTHSVERKGRSVVHSRGGTYKTVDAWSRKGGYNPSYGPSLVLLNPHEHCVIPWHGPIWHYGVDYLNYLREKDLEI